MSCGNIRNWLEPENKRKIYANCILLLVISTKKKLLKEGVAEIWFKDLWFEIETIRLLDEVALVRHQSIESAGSCQII